VTDPLAGVLTDAWRLYRARLARLLAVAAAVYGPAVGLTVLVTANHRSAGWCDLADALATFLLITLVAGHPPAPGEGKAPTRVRLTTAVFRVAPAAAVLAATWLAMVGSESFMGHFEFVVAIPAIYLMFMWMLTVPVVVIEDLPARTGLRRTWQLIFGHGSAVVDTLAKLCGLWILVMAVPIFVISLPGTTVLLQRLIPTVIVGVGYGPFVAIVLTLTYYRLAAAWEGAADPALDAETEPAPAA
jgi:hypothetical protein